MATGLNKEIYRNISETILDVQGVVGIEKTSATPYGPFMILNLVICVDGNITVNAGDAIAEEVEKKIFNENKFIKGDIFITIQGINSRCIN